MKRIIFKVVYCSAEENQNGTFHFSPAFQNLEEAEKFAKQRDDDFVGIEKHYEVWDRYEWRPDWDRGEAIEPIDFRR